MKQQVVVIHGGDAFNSYEEYVEALKTKELHFDRMGFKDWKSGLGESLGAEFDVVLPGMPNKQNAKYLEWKIWFEKFIPHIQDEVILMGHSLGGIFLAKYLSEQLFPHRVKGTYLVAAPYNTEAGELADFVLVEAMLPQFEEQGGEVVLYHSPGDMVVPISHLEAYRKTLQGAEIRIIENRGHFNQESFPEIIERIEKMAS